MMLCSSVSAILFLSTPSARRATAAKGQGNIHVQISIHALREEGDQDTETGEIYKGDFYPRPPRGGRRDSETNGSKTIKFLSTPSARRATKIWGMGNIIIAISIHALREEGDSACPALVGSAQEFLSTPSARRATLTLTWNQEYVPDFYPRPPRGGRPGIHLVVLFIK